MIAKLRERVRQWWFTRDLLLVNFGNRSGRVPLVMLSRRQVADVVRNGLQVSFVTCAPEQVGWRFIVHVDSVRTAEVVAQELKQRRRHILEPLNEVLCIVHYRAEDQNSDSPPCWIGGDIALASVRAEDYWQNGNGAWILKNLQT